MVDRAALTAVPTLTTERLTLVPLGPDHVDDVWAGLQDPEAMRLTGTHAVFTEDVVRRHLERIGPDDSRADWAILDGAGYRGEVVLNELDEANASMNFRIALSGGYGRGVGTEATRAVLDVAFDVVGLRRVSLDVFDFNPRAIRSYEKCGFVREGLARDTLLWDGEWHSSVLMSVLSTDPRHSSDR